MMKPGKHDRYLTVSRVAEILGCTDRHVYDMVKEGKRTALRLGIRAIRISEKSLNEFVETNALDPGEFFGFEYARNQDSVRPEKVARPVW